MDRYLNISAGIFAFLFSFTIFLIMSEADLDVQITSLLLTVLSVFGSIVVFIASVLADMKARKKAQEEAEQEDQ